MSAQGSHGRNYRFSPAMEQLRKQCIVDPVLEDPRTPSSQLLFGYPFEEVWSDIIDSGRARFDQPYPGSQGDLSPADRVALYAYCNLPGHFFEMLVYFEKFLHDVSDQEIEKMHFLDIGCGPMTAGLALAQQVNARVPIDYMGIDVSQAMLDKAQQLERCARDVGLLHERSRVRFARSIDSVPHGPRTWRPLVVILSYLLASRTLDVEQLITSVLGYCERWGPGDVSVLYTNSLNELANQPFPEFHAALESNGFTLHAHDDTEDICYRLPSGVKTRRVRYALFHRPRQTTLTL